MKYSQSSDNVRKQRSSYFVAEDIAGSLEKDLMARGVKRIEIGERIRKLRVAMMSKRISEEIMEGRDEMSTQEKSENDAKQAETQTRETLDFPSTDPLALSCILDVKDEEIRQLHYKLEQAQRKLTDRNAAEREAESEKVKQLTKDLESKNNVVDVLEVRVAAKDRRIKRLTEDLEYLKRRNVELEVKLEFHDLNFISCEKQIHALENQVGPSTDDHDHDHVRSPSQESQEMSRHRATQIPFELEAIETLYLSTKLDYLDKVEKLQRERDECVMKLRSLELEASINNNVASFDGSDAPSPSFRERMKVLHSENAEYSRLVSSLTWQIENLRESVSKKEDKFQHERGILSRKNQSLENKIAALQIELRSVAGVIDGTEKSRHYRMFEMKLDDYISEISRLEERLRTKDRIIYRLRTKAVDKRLATCTSTSSEQPETSLSIPQPMAPKLTNKVICPNSE